MSFFANPNNLTGLGVNQELEVIRNPYCTISDVEDYIHRFDLDLGKNNDSADYEYWVGRAIKRAEREVDSVTMTSFHKVRRIEWHTGTLERTITVDFYPIIKVNTVGVYSAGYQNKFEYDGAGMAIDNEAGTISWPALYYSSTSIISPPFSAIGFTYLPGVRNIKFDYWYGWDGGVPDTGMYAGLRDATAKLAAVLLLRESEARQSQGLVSLNTGGQVDQYGAYSQYATVLKQEAYLTLARYRRVLIRGMFA